jgi:UDP-glucuronate decarboxylase
MSQTYLVTGGAGFIGSHLVERLLNDGFKVVCVDNFYTGTRDNLAAFMSNENFSVIEHDVITPYPESITNTPYNAIFHLACAASPVHYQAPGRRTHTTLTCVMGTYNSVQLANKNNCPLLISSTSEVYGDPEVHPQTEDYRGCVNPIGPRACYDEGKRAGETIAFDSNREDGTKIRVVRIFNTYGPRMCFNDGRIISNFVVQALLDQPITIYGDGKQTRSFQFVSDLIEGFLIFVKHPSELGPINIGNPDEHTVGEMAEIIKAKCGSKSTITYHPATEDDPKQRKPDITKAGKILNWKPVVQLQEGLEKTIAEFRARLIAEGKLSA